MREAVAELIRVVRVLRTAVPWQTEQTAYGWVPLLAVLLAWGMSVGLAGSLWCASPSLVFNVWALLFLIAPAVTGVLFTYLFDILEIGLGWRVLEIVIHLAASLGIFTVASIGDYGVITGIASAACAWIVGVRCASDIVDFRPDRLSAGYTDSSGNLFHHGLQRLLRNLLSLSFTVALLIGIIIRWQQIQSPVWAVLVSGIGSVLAATAGLVLMGWTRASVELRTWEAGEVVVWPGVASTWRRTGLRFAVVAGALGWLLPANISPWSRLSYNQFFVSLNSKIGPYFTRATRGSSTPTTGGVANNDLWREIDFELSGTTQFVMYVVLLAVVGWAIVRFYRLFRSGSAASRPENYDGDWNIWRWLIQAIRSFFKRLKNWYQDTTERFFEADAGKAAAQIMQGQAWRKRRTAPTEPGALVRYLFARFLKAGAARGRQREKGETAAEYRARLSPELQAEGINAVSDLTEIYQRIRYSQETANDSLAASCKRYWAAAMKALRALRS